MTTVATVGTTEEATATDTATAAATGTAGTATEEEIDMRRTGATAIETAPTEVVTGVGIGAMTRPDAGAVEIEVVTGARIEAAETERGECWFTARLLLKSNYLSRFAFVYPTDPDPALLLPVADTKLFAVCTLDSPFLCLT